MKSSFFQTPEFLSLPLFGLNISQSFVRLVKLKKTTKGLIPEKYESVTLSHVCDFFSGSGEYGECDELKSVLKKLKKKHSIQFVQLSVPEENTYVFKIFVPQIVLSEVKDFILNNIEQYIPLGSQEVFFDYKILKGQISEKGVPVVVTAIPKSVVEKYTLLLEECGICVVGCEPETHAIARSIITKGDANPYIIVNIHEGATNISVVEDGLVQYTQTIPVRTEDIKGDISPKTSTILKDTINKVIIFWFTSKESSVRSTRIENIILTGAYVDSTQLINFFENNLAVHARVANVWKNCFDISLYIPSISKAQSLEYAPCVGLSMFKIK